MRRRVERRIEAYHDGAVSRSGRERVERLLRGDLAGGRHLQKTAALGGMIREAWTEGPRAPTPEQLIAALRPAMTRIDAERAAATLSERILEQLASWARPAATAAVAAAAVVALFLLLPSSTPQRAGSSTGAGLATTSLTPSPASLTSSRGVETVAFTLQMPAVFEDGVALNVGVPQAIYDLAQGETPLMLFEADDGATVIWLLAEATRPGDLPAGGGWG